MRHSERRTLTSSSTSSQPPAFSLLSYSRPWWSMQLKQWPYPTRAGDPQCAQGTTSIRIWAELESSPTFETDSRDWSNCASRPQLLAWQLDSSQSANRSLSVSIPKSWGNTINPSILPWIHLACKLFFYAKLSGTPGPQDVFQTGTGPTTITFQCVMPFQSSDP